MPTLAVSLITTCARLTRTVRQRTGGATTAATWRALAIFDEHGPLRVSAFAELDGLTQPSATAMLRRLVDDGILAREPDPVDGRAVQLSLTAHGREALAERRASGAEAVAPLLAGLTDSERATLTSAVEILTRALDHQPPTTGRTPA